MFLFQRIFLLYIDIYHYLLLFIFYHYLLLLLNIIYYYLLLLTTTYHHLAPPTTTYYHSLSPMRFGMPKCRELQNTENCPTIAHPPISTQLATSHNNME